MKPYRFRNSSRCQIIESDGTTVRRITGSWPVILLLLSSLILLQSCASAPQSSALISNTPSKFTAPVLLKNVPFFPQELYQCGPAALATLLQSSGVSVLPVELERLVYLPNRKGSFQVEMVAATRSFSRLAYEFNPSLDTLLSEVNNGHPVLVLQNLGVSWYEKWHFAVVKGYDLERRKIIMNSGTRENYEVSLRAFENTWARSHYWALLVLEPGVVPISAESSAYFNAAVALEAHSPTDAVARAYANGLKRWPEDRNLLMAYANLHHGSAKLAEATGLLESVIQKYPDYAPAYNNLAQIQFEQGDSTTAARNVRKAIELGGRYSETYKQTLQDISDKLR